MIKLLKYYFYSFKHPEFKDFVDRGFGIKARHDRCKKYWEKHLEFTKELQRKTLRNLKPLSVAVLGAGRLLDIPVEDLAALKKVDFYDADPSLRCVWEKAHRKSFSDVEFNGHILDLTNSLIAWEGALKDFLSANKQFNESKLIGFFNNLQCNEQEILIESEAIFSINLLSQIPIFWKERVKKLLDRYWNLTADEQDNFLPSIQDAMNTTCKRLQQQHLDLLLSSKAKSICLITDQYFFYYKNNTADWLIEDALYLDIYNHFADRQVLHKESWLWHIAPQGLENKSNGTIHQVIALGW